MRQVGGILERSLVKVSLIRMHCGSLDISSQLVPSTQGPEFLMGCYPNHPTLVIVSGRYGEP